MDKLSILLEKYFSLPNIFKILIFAILWLIVAIIIYFVAINPQMDEIEKKKFECAKLEKEASEIIELKAKLKNFEKELAQLEEDFKLALKKLPDSSEITELLFNIYQNGKDYNLDFVLFKPGAVVKKEFFGIIPIDLKITGDYHDIGKFLYNISKMPRIVKVPIFDITIATNNTLNLNGKMETYVFIKEDLAAKKQSAKPKNEKNVKK